MIDVKLLEEFEAKQKNESFQKGRTEGIEDLAEVLIKKCQAKLGSLEYVTEDEIKECAEQIKEQK